MGNDKLHECSPDVLEHAFYLGRFTVDPLCWVTARVRHEQVCNATPCKVYRLHEQ